MPPPMRHLVRYLVRYLVRQHLLAAAAAACALACAVQAQPSVHEQANGQRKAQACAACHGADGNAVSGEFPNLAGQTWRYLYIQLKDYQEGRRKHPVMSAMAASLSRQDMVDLGNYYAAQTAKPVAFQADAAKVALGRAKASEALCAMCHLGGLAGQNDIPRLAGQQYGYTVQQLHDFKARRRTNDAGNMTSLAQTLTDADIENLAHYITSLR